MGLVGLVALGFTHSVPLLLVTVAVASSGTGIIRPTVTSMITQQARAVRTRRDSGTDAIAQFDFGDRGAGAGRFLDRSCAVVDVGRGGGCDLRNRAAVLVLMFASALFAQTVRVPFVGCESFGQAGEVPAPKGVEKAVRVKASAAQRLAYYKAGGPGVLAPRGWHCAGFYGSSGAELYVTPDLFNGTRAFSRDGGITGPAIQADYITTENGSGRFDAAQVLARVFPEQKAFVKSVMESLDRPSGLTFGPYPSDKLIVKTRRFVEYQTAPHSEGLGYADLAQGERRSD